MTTIDELKLVAEKYEYEYIDRITGKRGGVRLVIKCKKGHITEKRLDVFRRGIIGCAICKKLETKSTKRLSYNFIKEQIEKEGYFLLSTEYINANTKLLVQCNNNHEYEVKYSDFYSGYRCMECYRGWKTKYKDKYSYSPFYNTFANQLLLLEETRRNKDDQNILEVKCTYCGAWYIPKLYNVKNRIRAINGKTKGEYRFYCSEKCIQECSIYHTKNYPKGFKKYNKDNTREVQPELRKLVFERDNYTCQKCGKHQSELEVGLHCHHLEGIHWEPIESADMDKCITHCKNCHEEDHQKEGCKKSDMQCK